MNGMKKSSTCTSRFEGFSNEQQNPKYGRSASGPEMPIIIPRRKIEDNLSLNGRICGAKYSVHRV